MAKRRKVDLNAEPSDAVMWLQKPIHTEAETPEPTPEMDPVTVFEWIEAAVESGLRIEIRWGSLGSLDPKDRGKRIAMATAMPNSMLFDRAEKWQKSTKEHNTVIGALIDLMKLVPQIEERE